MTTGGIFATFSVALLGGSLSCLYIREKIPCRDEKDSVKIDHDISSPDLGFHNIGV
jgi:hypothetical protein